MKSTMTTNPFLLIPLLCILLIESAWSQQPPRLIVYNGAKLAAARQAFLDARDRMSAEVKNLLREADKALDQKPVSVTSKNQVPPSGDRRDYMSLAPYWWPDPSKKDGLPYVRKDGQVNPERFDFKDRELFMTLHSCVTSLAAAYFVANKDEHGAHAARMLRAWFLDSLTRMNPNMNFSEAIKGRNTGRGAGIIGLCMLPSILDAVILIRGSKHWTPVDESGLVSWCRSYLMWLRTSPNGIDEQDSPNNHGTWYDVQIASLALFIGEPDTAKRILQDAKTLRIASQIEPDGRMPKELERTRGIGYGSFNLLAMATLARIATNVGVDLWHYESADGRSIRKAIDWMVPYYDGTKKWEYQQITEWDPGEAVIMLNMAGSGLGGSYAQLASKISKNESALLRARLLN